MAEVLWTEGALSDLRNIIDYLAEYSPVKAEVVGRQLSQAPRLLRSSPRLGRRVPEFGRDDIREMIVRPYRLLYLVGDDDVCRVAAVIHGRRNLAGLFRPEDRDDRAAGTAPEE